MLEEKDNFSGEKDFMYHIEMYWGYFILQILKSSYKGLLLYIFIYLVDTMLIAI